MPAALRTVRVSLCASHLGYSVDRTPLGGGAVVAGELARLWSAEPGLELSLIGSGPVLSLPAGGQAGPEYSRAAPSDRDLTELGELDYARFCRRFEAESTRLLLEAKPDVVVVNDVSESPDLARLKGAGIRVASIWHVDVADFFSRMYLGGLPTRLAVGAYERLRPLRGALPDVLHLVFEKQRASVSLSDLLVVPSKGVAETLLRCYPDAALAGRLKVIPWGAVGGEPADREAGARIRREHGLPASTLVLLTLSRISPEKGLPRLLEALRLVERRGGPELALFVCGAPAFMRGRNEERRLRRLASALERTRVFFPGYVAGPAKRAYFGAADVFVAPSVHESYGLSAAEALAAGLPVVAAANNGMRELLGNGGGVLVPEASFVESLAEALDGLAGDEPRRKLFAPSSDAAPPFQAAAGRLAREVLRLAGEA